MESREESAGERASGTRPGVSEAEGPPSAAPGPQPSEPVLPETSGPGECPGAGESSGPRDAGPREVAPDSPETTRRVDTAHAARGDGPALRATNVDPD